jgi:hypothetical protein
MPTGGGFKWHTEYEVGANRIGEAAHCILGSGNELVHSDKLWHGPIIHMLEEMNIIKNALGEYTRPIYPEMAYDSEMRDETLRSLKENARKLREKVAEYKAMLANEEDVDPHVREVMNRSYMLLDELAISIIEREDELLEKNFFADPDLHDRALLLERGIEELIEQMPDDYTKRAVTDTDYYRKLFGGGL